MAYVLRTDAYDGNLKVLRGKEDDKSWCTTSKLAQTTSKKLSVGVKVFRTISLCRCMLRPSSESSRRVLLTSVFS